MRGPHVRFCERRGGVIFRAYSTNPGAAITRLLDRFASLAMTGVGGLGYFPALLSGNSPARMRQTFASETDSHAPLPNPPISA